MYLYSFHGMGHSIRYCLCFVLSSGKERDESIIIIIIIIIELQVVGTG